MNSKTIFIGVAWPYVNGDLHVGHVAGYLLPADITARFFRLCGAQVLMVSGSDCFGTPITVEADKLKLPPREVVELYHPKNLRLFESLGLSFDLYTKTDTDNHRRTVQDFLLAFGKRGLLEVGEQKQYFSRSLQRFLPDRYVEGECPYCHFKGARSDQCDNCGRLLEQNLIRPVAKIDSLPVELKSTQHLFIRWDKLQPEIEKFVKGAKDWRPWVLNETKRWLKEGLKKRAVTRDLDWGVEIPRELAASLPGAANKRIYVWFDAVIGYFSASVEWSKLTGKPWEDFWYSTASLHYYFMGKDNLVFHTIFWPGQLMTYDSKLHLPDYPAINQYLTLEGQKFSKSRRVIVDTAEFIAKYGPDPLRFYLASIMPEDSDSNFSWTDFFKKNNGVLVGHIGNYVHRTLSLYQAAQLSGTIDAAVVKQSEQAVAKATELLSQSRLREYFEQIEALARFANGYFDQKQPWVTKKNRPEEFAAAGPSLVALTFVLMALLEPLTPFAAQKYFALIGIDNNLLWQKSAGLGAYLNKVVKAIKLNPPQPLFAKFDQE